MFSALFKFLKEKNISSGFTLIELLVVISIIALLFGAAAVSYTDIQKKARDGRRKADLAAIQQALEVFYADNGGYPTEYNDHGTGVYDNMSCDVLFNNATQDNISFGGAYTCSFDLDGDGQKDDRTTTYMQKVPTDPLGGSYRYFYDPDELNGCQTEYDDPDAAPCQHYTLMATLENKKDPDIAKTTSSGICTEIPGDKMSAHDGRANYFYTGDGTHPDERYLDHTNNEVRLTVSGSGASSNYNGGLGEKMANYCVHDPKSP